MSVSVQVIFYSDHQGCVRAVNKTLIRLLGGSDHRSDHTGIHLSFLPTCNVNSFAWDRGLKFNFFLGMQMDKHVMEFNLTA